MSQTPHRFTKITKHHRVKCAVCGLHRSAAERENLGCWSVRTVRLRRLAQLGLALGAVLAVVALWSLRGRLERECVERGGAWVYAERVGDHLCTVTPDGFRFYDFDDQRP